MPRLPYVHSDGTEAVYCLADCHTGEPMPEASSVRFDIYACTLLLGHDGPHDPPYFER